MENPDDATLTRKFWITALSSAAVLLTVLIAFHRTPVVLAAALISLTLGAIAYWLSHRFQPGGSALQLRTTLYQDALVALAMAAGHLRAEIEQGATPQSYPAWSSQLTRICGLGSPRLISAALHFHEVFSPLAIHRCKDEALLGSLNNLRDHTLLQVAKLPPDSSEEHENLLLKATRLHQEAGRILENRSNAVSNGDVTGAYTALLDAIRQELGSEGSLPQMNERLRELEAAHHQAENELDADLKALVANPARVGRKTSR